eukprot:1070589-Pyramimonas_sp.AAC.1
MAPWACQRCYRLVKSHHQFCLCGQESPNNWCPDYERNGKESGVIRGLQKANGKPSSMPTADFGLLKPVLSLVRRGGGA